MNPPVTPIVVIELSLTCIAAPSQWEGKTSDGQAISIRYRHGNLSIGLGATIDEAVGNRVRDEQLGDMYDGIMIFEDLLEAIPDWLTIAVSEGEVPALYG